MNKSTVETQSPIYRFASLRNPNSEFSSDDVKYVELKTKLISDLSEIVESDIPKSEKLEQYNTILQGYIDSDYFVKSKKPFKDVSVYAAIEPSEIIKILYDNIVVRTLTKSTNNEIFKLLVEWFKKEYTKEDLTKRIEITLPESITPSFIGYKGENKEPDEKEKKERKKLNHQIKYNNDVIDRLTDESIVNYKKRRQYAPWKQPKSIINIAFEGYAYGSEMGQVKDVSDHSYIVPLYSYGIGTYNFKMNKIKPLVTLAQAKAEEKVKEFFK